MAASPLSNTTKLRTELAAAPDVDRLNRLFRRVVRSHGFSTYAIGFVPERAIAGGIEAETTRPFLLLDWPRAWLELYAREGFAADDVVVAEAARTTEPFTWSQVRARHPGASERIFAAAAEFGWRDGFVIPFHDQTAPPGERFGVASLAAPRLLDVDAELHATMAMLAFTAFGRARTLVADGSGGVPGGLKDRERDVLILVAEGRDDAEIGTILGISRSGAHFHIENAKKRLGASTRAQAVAIALIRGLL